MKSARLARTALSAAVFLALGGAQAANPALQMVSAHVVSPEQLNDATASDASLLLLRSGLIDPQMVRIDFSSVGAAAEVQASRYAIVQFDGDPAAARARLEKRGITFLGYVPNNAYQVRLEATTLAELRADADVRWVGLYQPGLKLDPALWSNARATLVEAADGGFTIDAFGFAGESADRIAAALTKVAGVSIVSIAANDNVPFVRANVGQSGLAALVVA
ncbi:MAG: hypothetical protein ABI650_10805, partial [Dokdonella sp.]